MAMISLSCGRKVQRAGTKIREPSSEADRPLRAMKKEGHVREKCLRTAPPPRGCSVPKGKRAPAKKGERSRKAKGEEEVSFLVPKKEDRVHHREGKRATCEYWYAESRGARSVEKG